MYKIMRGLNDLAYSHGKKDYLVVIVGLRS